jgi:branched-chain amino acid transport system ATP-binding protein
MKTIAGVLQPRSGTVSFLGEEITGLPSHKIVRRGVALVPEGRAILSRMTVRENLDMGAFTRRGAKESAQDMDRVMERFPVLKERAGQLGGSLSGGEQQMLAIARALMSRPRLLLLDEPSLGLAPLIVRQIFDAIRTLNAKDGLTVFLVEQNAYHALRLAHRGYVMVNGRITLSGTGRELLDRPEVKSAYLEGGRQQAAP